MAGQGAETTTQVGQLERVESGCTGDLRLSGHGRGLEVTAELGRVNNHLAAVGAAATAYETGYLEALYQGRDSVGVELEASAIRPTGAGPSCHKVSINRYCG